ncbi:MAG: branched-chain amino acid ABC transporter permease [Gemmatimonadaceae bacterium]|nr:branched-chain amino acid ABC transporter permease [Acetobacteraceae bacterium]
MTSVSEPLAGPVRGPDRLVQAFRPYLTIVGAIALVAGLVAATAGGFWLSTMTSVFALSLATLGVGVLYGRLGLVSLCQYALVGVGGWAALRLQFAFDLPFELAALGGGVAAMAVGMVWGLPALRLRGLYLALVTLMLAGAFQVVISATGFPDGGPGFLGRVAGTGRVMMARPALVENDTAYFLYVAFVFAAGALLVEAHVRNKPGRSWALIRKDERMAAAAGVPIVRYKLWAFALAGFVAGLSGALLAGGVGQLDGRAFSANESVLLFVLSVVGGAYGWFGALVAGLLIRAVPALLNNAGVNGFAAMILFGAAVLHAFATSSTGIAGQIGGLARRLGQIATRYAR